MKSAIDTNREATLIEALDALERGEPLEEILRRYPAHASQLCSLLDTAVELSALSLTHSADAEATSRKKFLSHAEELRQQSHGEQPARTPFWRRLVVTFASVGVVLLMLGVSLATLSSDALPGDSLYSVKRLSENIRLFVAPVHQKEELRQELVEERNREVYRMLKSGRDGVAGYTGTIEALGDRRWEIGHLEVIITGETVITGSPVVGAQVEAHCFIVDGQVIAQSLEIVSSP